MVDRESNPVEPNDARQPGSTHQPAGKNRRAGSGMSKSMHDGVEVWCDCCSCEAEPYWIEAMEETEDPVDS